MATLPRSSGVYKATCYPTAKLYIGSSVNMRARVGQHVNRLRRGLHPNPHLQSAWDRYGEAAFNWEVVEERTSDELLIAEQCYLDLYQAYDRRYGFNIRTQAESNAGLPGPRHSDEVRQRLSESKRGHRNPMWGKSGELHSNFGKKWPAALIERWRAAHKGTPASDNQRAAASRTWRGRKRSAENVEKLRQRAIERFGNPETNPNVGKRRTPEQRTKIGRGKAKCYIVTHQERGTFFVRDMKAFCAIQILSKARMCTACMQSAYYRGYAVRYATEDEIQAYLAFLGEDGYIIL